jgi:hypothetical protein
MVDSVVLVNGKWKKPVTGKLGSRNPKEVICFVFWATNL